jgi:hypothetical protein
MDRTIIKGINDEEYARRRVQAEVDLAQALEEQRQHQAIVGRAGAELTAAQAAARDARTDAEKVAAAAVVDTRWERLEQTRAAAAQAEQKTRGLEARISRDFLGRVQAYRPGMFLTELGKRIEHVSQTVRAQA